MRNNEPPDAEHSDNSAEQRGALEAARQTLEATTGAAVLRGSGWNALSGLIPQIYLLIQSVIAARFLGPAGMGRQSFIAFVEISVVMLMTGGLSLSVMRYVSELLGRGSPARVRGLVRWGWGLAAAGALLGAGGMSAIAWTGAEPTAAWSYASVAAALGILQTIPMSVLLGTQSWKQASVVSVVTGGLATIASAVVLWAGGGISGLFAVEVVITAVNLAWVSRLARSAIGALSDHTEPPGEIKGPALRYAAGATLETVLVLIVFRRSEFYFLERFSSDAQIAFYSIAFSMSAALMRVPDAFAAVIAPAFASLFGAGNQARIRSGFARALRLVLLVTFPLTSLAMVTGPALLEAVYGSDYSAARPALVILILSLPLVALNGISGSLCTGFANIRAPLIVSALAAVTNLALDVTLIPRLDATGAALANAAAQMVAAAGMLIFALRLAGKVNWRPAILARGLIASVVSGSGALVAMQLPNHFAAFFAGGLLWVVLFIAIAVRLKIISSDDATWFKESAGSLLPHPAIRLLDLVTETPLDARR